MKNQIEKRNTDVKCSMLDDGKNRKAIQSRRGDS